MLGLGDPVGAERDLVRPGSDLSWPTAMAPIPENSKSIFRARRRHKNVRTVDFLGAAMT
jgi:hypothetical protein